ncbi:MAG: ABC transporter substrate-binding protein [Eubacteriaceae bacterium]|nr:ABC transporter substrate-binding protein [Eubacteriaceae bacterium]
MKKFLALMLALALVLSFSACGKSGKEETASGPITVVDQMGNEVTLEKVPDKIVVLTAAPCEIIFALGAGDKVIARGKYCDYPEEVLGIPETGSAGDTNIEDIIAKEPDLVIWDSMGQTEDQYNALTAAGIPVLSTNADTIETTYESIILLGKVLGKDQEAETIVNDMKQAFEQIEKDAKDAGVEGKTVYFEVSPLQWGLWSAGKETFMQEIADLLGLKNIFDDTIGWVQVSEEQIIERNPDYIVTITMYYGEGPRPEEEIASRPGWENVSAVKDGNILCIDTNLLSRPAPRLVDGAKTLLEFITREK